MGFIFRKEEWGSCTSRLTMKGRIVQESGPTKAQVPKEEYCKDR